MLAAKVSPDAIKAEKLLIFDTHPIQYRSPVFRALAETLPAMKVFFFAQNFDGKKWWFHEVGKIPKQTWGIKLDEGFPCSVMTRPHGGLFAFWRELGKIFAEEKPSAVLTYGYYLPEHWTLWLRCQFARVPLIFIGETMPRKTTSLRETLKSLLLPVFFSGVDRVVSIGNKSMQFYRQQGVPENKVETAKYCVDSDFFAMSEEESRRTRASLRQDLGIPVDAFVILFVGRLFDRKRPQDVIALHQSLQHRKDVYTVIVGNGPMEEMVQNEAKNFPRLLAPGFKNQLEIRNYYHASDLLFVPSEYETWGLVVNEAFAARLPAAVTEQCGCADDLVETNETGLVFPVGNVSKVAAWVATMLDAKREYQRLRETAYRRVTEQFTVSQFSQKIESAFRLLAKKN